MKSASNIPVLLSLPFCIVVLGLILVWYADLSASNDTQRPYVPPSETPAALLSTLEDAAREVLIAVAPGIMDFPEGKTVAQWHEFENVHPALRNALDRHAPEILIKVFPDAESSRTYKIRFPHGADRAAISEELQHLPGVEFAEPNQIGTLGYCPDYVDDTGPEGAVASDFDGDGRVGFADFIAFAGAFGRSSGDEQFDAGFDLDDDDTVGFGDFVIFAGNFGKLVGESNGAICGRTSQVRHAILRALSDVDNCALVTREHLASIQGLVLVYECINGFREGDFANLSNLKGLELSSNDLTTLPEGTFAGLDSLKILELRYNRLTSLPEGAFSGLSNLRGLALSGNNLETLPEGIFSDLASLRRLSLKNNSLSALPVGMFSGLDSLRTLVFKNNNLESLPVGVFAGLSALRSLFLDANALGTLPAGLFSDQTRLERLELRKNVLHTLPAGAFAGLNSVRTLMLEDNELGTLVDGVFNGMGRLETLSLFRNAISTVQGGAFSGLSNLRVLMLSENELTTLPEGVFSGLKKLQAVWLFNNSLIALPAAAFSGLDSLRALVLSDNNLSTLPEGMFSGLYNLGLLSIGNNPGAPFTLTIELERTDNLNTSAPGPATVVARVAEGAPFDMTVNLAVQAGSISDSTATILKGHIESESFVVTRTGSEPTTVSPGAAPEIPVRDDGYTNYHGILTAVGPPIVLFPKSTE